MYDVMSAQCCSCILRVTSWHASAGGCLAEKMLAFVRLLTLALQATMLALKTPCLIWSTSRGFRMFPTSYLFRRSRFLCSEHYISRHSNLPSSPWAVFALCF